jgi:type II secretory ATPase GspE/PulE/Tfp pilus assembly ATPase PilB-like protein
MAQSLGRGILVNKTTFKKAEENLSDFKKLQEIIDKSDVKEANEIIFSAATLLGTGDIHIEPGAENVHVRFRIDGILQTVVNIPLTDYPNLLGEKNYSAMLKQRYVKV